MKRVMLAALLFTACQQEQAPITETTAAASDTMSARQTGVDAGANAQSATGDQEVQLLEYEIRMPQTLPAGEQAFHVVNAGKELHSLEIEGNGVHSRLPSDLSAGSSAHHAITLKPGTYTVYCPVKDHRQRGMSTTITVQ
ncbi:MAG: hypothetical protein ACXW2P_07590 [Thermoanaerobaculia bacterium]